MNSTQRKAIENWIDNIPTNNLASQPASASHACCSHKLQESLLTPPGTSALHNRTKRRLTELDAESNMSCSEPQKRLRRTLTTDTASLPVSLPDSITLSPSVTTRSDITASDRPRQRSSSPNRTKSNLTLGTPKIKFLHESADPGSDLARQLLVLLTADNEKWEPEAHEIDKISAASCKCDAQLRSEGSWVIEVVRPLLQCAIGKLPLECWSVQTETVDPKYQPRYAARGTYNRKIDLVVGFPVDEWSTEYEGMASRYPDQCFSHIAHPHTGARFLGPGFEVKASDGNLVEAQVQLGVWMAGLMTWAWDHRWGDSLPPPVVGCISIGERWDFYIIYSVEVDESARPEVRVWGPLSDLDGRTGTCKATAMLAKRLRRVMEYTESQYIQQLLRAITT